MDVDDQELFNFITKFNQQHSGEFQDEIPPQNRDSAPEVCIDSSQALPHPLRIGMKQLKK